MFRYLATAIAESASVAPAPTRRHPVGSRSRGRRQRHMNGRFVGPPLAVLMTKAPVFLSPGRRALNIPVAAIFGQWLRTTSALGRTRSKSTAV